ncbi:hypothetical protein [Serinicoccus marinus]|uniref:hypothetical protein n=1 Tax=Serinicoccus marinus TaxID=247333 RepID=UPI00249163DA|nr:hypothetical protein [Serinicoccus marinus]
MAQRPRSSGRAPALAVLGALMIVGGVVVVLSTPVSFGWFADQPIEPARIVLWHDVAAMVLVGLGAVVLGVACYRWGRAR